MKICQLGRRAFLLGTASLLPAIAPSLASAQQAPRVPSDPSGPPIVFVHGAGDSAAQWINTIWRFESNGFRRDALFAADLSYPLPRADNSKPQDFRSSTDDQMKELASYIAQVKKATGQAKVMVIAHSRGGSTLRNYLKNGDGASSVSHAILCGSPNRGVVISDTMMVGSEFNGAMPFLKDLNAAADDLIPGVQMMAIRSDKNDRVYQPDGRFIGFPGKPTGVSFDSPELRGAKNVIIDGLDHRETALHKLAFAAQFEFLTGKPPATLLVAEEPQPALNGRVTGVSRDATPTNLPVEGALVEIYDVDPRTGERKGSQPVHRKTTGADGQWGPFAGRSDASYEFVLAIPGQPVTHIYRSRFLRGSNVIDLRPLPFGKGDDQAGAVVVMSRPRGFFGLGRDKLSFDGKVPPGLTEGVPAAFTAKLAFDADPRTVMAVFNDETIAARTWPVKENHMAVAEFMN
jgi:triacylglycerol lipase